MNLRDFPVFDRSFSEVSILQVVKIFTWMSFRGHLHLVAFSLEKYGAFISIHRLAEIMTLFAVILNLNLRLEGLRYYDL